jgi:ribonucleotide monophosphatase NagD (HAD superfamily)
MKSTNYQWTTVKDLASKYDYFLMDCDGVVWSGSHEIDHAFEVIQWLET